MAPPKSVVGRIKPVVLVVDDSPVVRKLIDQGFKRLGYCVGRRATHRGSECFECLLCLVNRDLLAFFRASAIGEPPEVVEARHVDSSCQAHVR